MRKDLVTLDLEKRLRVPGLEPRRADLAVAGAILLDEDPAAPRRAGADALRPVVARGSGPRLHRAAPQGNRPGRSLSRRPPAQRLRARRALQLLARALAAGGAPGSGAVRSDARAFTASPTASATGSSTPRSCTTSVCTSATRVTTNTRITWSRTATCAASSRTKSRRLPWSRATIARRRRSAVTTGFAICGGAPGARCVRWRRFFDWQRASTAATRRRSPDSSSTIAATTICCSCGPRATPSWSCGRRRVTPSRSNASPASPFASK